VLEHEIIKHVEVTQLSEPAEGEQTPRSIHSRVAIFLEGDFGPRPNRLVLRTIAGPAIPLALVSPVLSLAIPEWEAWAEELHHSRRFPWRIERHVGMSGCVDYLLRIQRDAVLRDEPIKARLHISMFGKLNRGIELWLGDLLPLLRAAEFREGIEAANAARVIEGKEPPFLLTLITPPDRVFFQPGQSVDWTTQWGTVDDVS
jgi:hypothetical protein